MSNDILSIVELSLNSVLNGRLNLSKSRKGKSQVSFNNYDLNEMSRIDPWKLSRRIENKNNCQ